MKIVDINKQIKMIDINGVDHTSFFIQGDEKNILIESGYPSETDLLFEGIEKLGLTISDIDYFIATHIHLDHVGAAGYLASKNRNLIVFIHEIGARHLINPERLNESAKRAYKERFSAIGSMVPAPAEQVHPLQDLEEIELGGNSIRVHFTPGHAKHHLIILEKNNNILFTGDAMGANYPGVPLYITVPPPDYNKEQALKSIDLIKELDPSLLIFTHFGRLNPSKRENVYNQIKNKHKFWCNSIKKILKGNSNISKKKILEIMLKKTSILDSLTEEIRKIYEQVTINSFNLNIEGVSRYLKKNNLI
ncbi:MAG: MBL fold metallo-hydrolase [Candidatus Helarchaeota archaeon]|nr:MBL fold metallo-hydrolase [Candidatus Helarchaeota archaeon]